MGQSPWIPIVEGPTLNALNRSAKDGPWWAQTSRRRIDSGPCLCGAGRSSLVSDHPSPSPSSTGNDAVVVELATVNFCNTAFTGLRTFEQTATCCAFVAETPPRSGGLYSFLAHTSTGSTSHPLCRCSRRPKSSPRVQTFFARASDDDTSTRTRAISSITAGSGILNMQSDLRPTAE
jgi:hypothetical protein